MEAAKAQAGHLARVAAAALIIAAAWGKVPMPVWPAATVAPVVVDTPSDEMQRLVTPIGAALKNLNAVDRALWAETWNKAAIVVEGDAISKEVAFTDTRSLRAFTSLAIDIAWRRIGGNEPGSNEALRKAVEAAYAAGIGPDGVAVSRAVRERYAAFARAVAWAGIGEG